MKKYLLPAIIFLVMLPTAIMAGCAASPAAGGVNTVNLADISGILSGLQQGIVISGEGKVSVTPDIVNINIGVEDQETKVAAAQAKASQAMNDIMNVLKSFNIADKDIQTQQFNISPIYTYDEKTRTSSITGYDVNNIVNVKVRDISKAGQIIDAAAAAGGDLTRINSISFSVDNPSQYYDEARHKAMDDANGKATQLATLGGVTLGKPTYISESTSGNVTPIYYTAKADSAAGAAPSTSISTGSTDIIINVQVTYAIK